MSWDPITLVDLQTVLSRDLAECSVDQREFFRGVSVAPVKWSLLLWGNQGGGFWTVAIHLDRVLWYNDIEGGFNVSRFDVQGEIPADEYGCDQDPLRWALPKLQGAPGTRLGPPEPVGEV